MLLLLLCCSCCCCFPLSVVVVAAACFVLLFRGSSAAAFIKRFFLLAGLRESPADTHTYTRTQPHASHRYTLTHTHTHTGTQTTACGCHAHSSVLHYRYFMTEVHFEQIPFTLLRLPFTPPPRPFSNVIRKFKYIYTFFLSSFFLLLLLLPPSSFISAVVLPKENLLPSKLQCVARTIKQSAHFHWQYNKTGLARALACCSSCLTSLSPFAPYSYTCPFLVLLPF